MYVVTIYENVLYINNYSNVRKGVITVLCVV